MKTNVAIDELGRVLLPEAVRDAIGVTSPGFLDLELVDDAVRLTAPEAGARKEEINYQASRPVFAGPLPPDWDSAEAVRQMRARIGS